MPTFSYNLNIPNGPNNPSSDQPLMQTNTNSINSLISQDHFTFGTGNDGYHQQVNLVAEASPALNGNLVLYTLNNTAITGGRQVLWAKNSAQDLPLFTGPAAGSTNGYSSIYGGIILQWGTVAPTSSTTVTVNFLLAGNINFPNNIFNVQVTRQRTTSDPGSAYEYYVDNTTVATTGFNIINRDGHTYGYYWFAIGN